MPVSPYVARLRRAIGSELLLLPSVTVLPRDASGRVLLVRHADSGEWGTIGGTIEPGESPTAAAVRETKATFDDEHLRDESEDDSISELSSNDQHPADIGSETFEREKDLSILEQVEAELADVEHALRRLEDGTYGICEACGQPIDEAR